MYIRTSVFVSFETIQYSTETMSNNYCLLHTLVVNFLLIPMVFLGIDNDANDIALLKLDKPLDLRHKDTNTLCLPTPNQIYDRSSCTVAGWGDKSKFNPFLLLQRLLQKLKIRIELILSNYKNKRFLTFCIIRCLK